jgi:hypothetical protein
LIAEIGDAGFLIFLDFRKPTPRSQGCEVRAFLNSLDTGGLEKFQRWGSKRDSSAAQADSFADERGEKASACSGPAGGGQAE